MTHHTDAELLHALEESQSLFAAMLHEPRPTSEIQKQMEQNRAAIDAARRAPASQALRVPLSDEKLRSIFDDLWPHGADAGIRKLFTATVFAIERAHGIKQEKQG